MTTAANKITIIKNFGEKYIDIPEIHDFKYECPHCKDIGKRYNDYKLFVNYDNLVFHCFRCGWKGKLSSEEFLEEGSTNKFLKAISMYHKKETAEVDEQSELVFKIPSIIPSEDDPSVIYLKNRGVSYEDVLYYHMRVPTNEDPSKFFGRIVIPNKLIAGKWTDMY